MTERSTVRSRLCSLALLLAVLFCFGELMTAAAILLYAGILFFLAGALFALRAWLKCRMPAGQSSQKEG